MFSENLKIALEEYNLKYSDDMLQKFALFYNFLTEWNKKVNLTAITEENEFIRKHLLDSLSAITLIDKGKILDIGAGAGFPGIPLKIYQENLNITLMDALQKRINFLEEVIRELKLNNISTLHARAEDAAKTDLRESFDTVISRAVASLPTLLEYALPFLKDGGKFIAWKGSKTNEEINSSANALNLLGGKIVEVKQIIIPNLQEERYLIIIKKERTTPLKYPRRAGTPLKKPL